VYGRRGLIGLGVAGGLVPSPSALIVLLGAIALGRTWFGIMLVIAYGAGMAATLTVAGLLLVHLRNRIDAAPRVGRWSGIWVVTGPILTATLVLVVGLGLALHSALPLFGTSP
jgi:ABC-type nickel/cobalt efflux system permease component RcnA